MRSFDLCLIRPHARPGEPSARLGVPLLDEYLRFLSGRRRPNTVLAAAYVGVRDRATHRAGVDRPVVRPVSDDQSGVSLRTVRRRSSSVSGLYAFLHARGDVPTNPVSRGLPTRRERQRPHQGVPLVRATRTLPGILTPAEVDALMGALRTHRDRAMVAAMVLGGLRRCEVLGLRMEDLRVAQRRVFVAEGKGWSPAAGAGLAPVLRPRRRLPPVRAPGRHRDRFGVRGVEGTEPRETVDCQRFGPPPSCCAPRRTTGSCWCG
jgi:integrase/recombinase XerD